MVKQYTKDDLLALLDTGDEDAAKDYDIPIATGVRYVFRNDGLWLAMDDDALRLINRRELAGIVGLKYPEPKNGEPGLYGLSGQRPVLPFPFTVRELLAFDERVGGQVYGRCECGDELAAWIDELEQAAGVDASEAEAQRNAAELARYVMGLEDVPEDGETAQQANQPAEVPDPLLQPPVDTEIPRGISRTQEQDATVIAAIRNLGHDPKALPAWQYGSPGVKAAVKKAIERNSLFVGTTVFEKAWERLRSRGEIAEAKPSH